MATSKLRIDTHARWRTLTQCAAFAALVAGAACNSATTIGAAPAETDPGQGAGGPSPDPGGSSADGGNGGAGGVGGGVPCEAAQHGDKCGGSEMQCGVLECYGCSKYCDESGLWNVSCTEAPTCDDVAAMPPPQATYCDGHCQSLTCGPWALQTACGLETVQASCSYYGWYYELSCDPACEAMDEVSCKQTVGCAWAVPCGDPAIAPTCIDFPPFDTCATLACASAETCVDIQVDTRDFSSGSCDVAGSLISICVPD